MADAFGWIVSGPQSMLALAFGYLLGSIPFGLLLTRLAGTEDIRSIGSGNIGATNVLRTGRKGLAAATLLGDALKGTAAVLIAGLWGAPLALIAGLGAFLGHLFPVWLGFKGGKGVATFLGILFGLWWPGGLVFAAVWLLTAYAFRYSSLAALVASSVIAPALLWSGQHAAAMLFLVLTLLVFVVHRANIQRLIHGTEGKIGQKG
jgi:acyl phosphate:glycerol-3-phosphate acyltransferase